MSKTKKYLPFPLFLLTLGIVGVTTWSIVKSLLPIAEPIGINEISSTGTVTLKFAPPSTTLIPNLGTTIPILIETTSASVTAAQVVVTYDPTKIEVTSVAPGNFLTNILSAPKLETGKVTFTFSVPASDGGKQGDGILANIFVNPLIPSQVNLVFDEPTVVSAISQPGNVLKVAGPQTYTIYLSSDLNHDKKINLFDYNVFISDYGKTGFILFSPADISRDGKVNIFDYNLFVADYGKTSP